MAAIVLLESNVIATTTMFARESQNLFLEYLLALFLLKCSFYSYESSAPQ